MFGGPRMILHANWKKYFSKIEVWHFTTIRDPPPPSLAKDPIFSGFFFPHPSLMIQVLGFKMLPSCCHPCSSSSLASLSPSRWGWLQSRLVLHPGHSRSPPTWPPSTSGSSYPPLSSRLSSQAAPVTSWTLARSWTKEDLIFGEKSGSVSLQLTQGCSS